MSMSFRIVPVARRGFTFIGILIAVVIIMILVGRQWGEDPQANLHKMSIERSNDAACRANRVTIVTQYQMWSINNPGRVPSIADLQAAGMSVPRCPDSGEFTILPNGGIHCTRHDAPIADVLRQSFAKNEAEAMIRSAYIQDLLRRHYPGSPDLVQAAPVIIMATPEPAAQPQP